MMGDGVAGRIKREARRGQQRIPRVHRFQQSVVAVAAAGGDMGVEHAIGGGNKLQRCGGSRRSQEQATHVGAGVGACVSFPAVPEPAPAPELGASTVTTDAGADTTTVAPPIVNVKFPAAMACSTPPPAGRSRRRRTMPCPRPERAPGGWSDFSDSPTRRGSHPVRRLPLRS